MLGFDDYPDIAARLRSIVAGEAHHPHTPQDRRQLLPITPVDRDASTCRSRARAAARPRARRSGQRPRAVRRRLDGGPMAPLKLACGCDRRCSFCAIPSFRGSFVSRRPSDVLAEARWLAGEGVRELFLVSENSTSYGKDLGDLRLLETLLPELAAVDGIERVRVSYLQPAETRPGLVEAIAEHARRRAVLRPVLPARQRRRCCAGCAASATPRASSACSTRSAPLAPEAGVRSNVIVGFPGETERRPRRRCATSWSRPGST